MTKVIAAPLMESKKTFLIPMTQQQANLLIPLIVQKLRESDDCINQDDSESPRGEKSQQQQRESDALTALRVLLAIPARGHAYMTSEEIEVARAHPRVHHIWPSTEFPSKSDRDLPESVVVVVTTTEGETVDGYYHEQHKVWYLDMRGNGPLDQVNSNEIESWHY